MAIKITRTIKKVDRKQGIIGYHEEPSVARIELFPSVEVGQIWELEVDDDSRVTGRIKSARIVGHVAS